jgi:antitoxin component YwqK of YwqJK toxin-antitoxin module
MSAINPFDEFETFEKSINLDISSDYISTSIKNDSIKISDTIYENCYSLNISFDEVLMEKLIDYFECNCPHNHYKFIIKGTKNINNHIDGNINIYLHYNEMTSDFLKEELKEPRLIIKTSCINSKLNGEFIFYDWLGGINYKCKYVNGKKHGKEYIYDLKLAINNYYHGSRHGMQIELLHKHIERIQNYHFDKKTDYEITYYKSGYIKSIDHYYNGKRDGSYIVYEDLEENIKNHKDTIVLRYPNVAFYRSYMNGFALEREYNKTGGKFDTEMIGFGLQEPRKDSHHNNFYELYNKYKNIKIDVEY